MNKTRSFEISKVSVWEAYKQVKSNRGAAGVDKQSISGFEVNLKNNLYKIWNRMSSGSYFPPPVLRVEIPKDKNTTRPLGIPTVSDRIAQMVAKNHMEPSLEKVFYEESYGYRPKKSADQAIGAARKNCWKYAWVVDLDIKGFFDNIDHELLMKAVRKHISEEWILLYVERWLKAPAQLQDGTKLNREKGTPQGGVVSPLLANLFLHYAFDHWMKGQYPENPFERYADDAIIHCKTEAEAKEIMSSMSKRFNECGLELHPQKTKIVYCKDGQRKLDYPTITFDFLGYTFMPRKARSKYGITFLNFSPAISDKAKRKIMEKVKSWKLQCRSDLSITDIARQINPVTTGWINYYGKYYKSALYLLFFQLDKILIRWSQRKFKKLRTSIRRTLKWWRRIAYGNKTLFSHWKLVSSFKVDC